MIKEYIDFGTIGDYLSREWLEPFGLSQNALAKAIGVPQNRISDIINGKRGITADTDLRLCRYFGLSDGVFTGIQQHYEHILAKRAIEKELLEIIPYANDNFKPKRKKIAM
ncbi:MAG: HigA family addiction module antidote protein [Rickettsiales bacterium]|jgi:addiction module HigA family antidote|nr:HigA family addiction module antidote protein [Rickettsiales bacterium]